MPAHRQMLRASFILLLATVIGLSFLEPLGRSTASPMVSLGVFLMCVAATGANILLLRRHDVATTTKAHAKQQDQPSGAPR